MTSPNFSDRINEAATWLLIADLMRHHEAAYGLRVIETHPGGGQYDCRTVLTTRNSVVSNLIDFNLASGNAHISSYPAKAPPHPALPWASDQGDRLAYVAAAVQSNDRAEVRSWLEAAVGLPVMPHAPPWSRHALAYGVMAGIAARHAFLGAPIRWENGVIDTSGYPPHDPVRPEVRALPAFAERLGHVAALATPLHHPAYEAWLLMVTGKHGSSKAVAVIGIDAQLHVLGKPDKPIDLYSQWQKAGKNLPTVVERLHGLVATWREH